MAWWHRESVPAACPGPENGHLAQIGQAQRDRRNHALLFYSHTARVRRGPQRRAGHEVRHPLSVDIDGTRVYSIYMSRVITPSSGQNAVGMFRSEDRQSLYAWIDPVSGTCHIVSETTPQAFLHLAHLAALLTFGAGMANSRNKAGAILASLSAGARLTAWRFETFSAFKRVGRHCGIFIGRNTAQSSFGFLMNSA